MENNIFKWHLHGPGYSKTGISFAMTEESVRSQLKSRGYVAADNAIIQEIDKDKSLHVLFEASFNANMGCN